MREKNQKMEWIHGAKEGRDRKEARAEKLRGRGAIGSRKVMRIFTHKGGQFANC